MNDSSQQQPQKPILYAVVELFGHARIAGAVSEQTFGGDSFVRVDVPEITVQEVDYENRDVEGRYVRRDRVVQAHTRSFGAKAIYGINWCDEATAVQAAREICDEPLKPYSAKAAVEALRGSVLERLPAPASRGDRFDDRFDDDQPY